MEEDRRPLPLEYSTPTRSRLPEPLEIDVASPAAWVAGGLMLLSLLVVLVGFLLRTLGIWSENTGSIIAMISFGLFGASVLSGMYAIYRAISQLVQKK